MKLFKKKLVDLTVKDGVKLYFIFIIYVAVDRSIARAVMPSVNRLVDRFKDDG